MVRTDHILFIAAGAFHVSKPSDLIPELQGRFPIRVELEALGRDEFVRILTEPRSALVKQYMALMDTEGIDARRSPTTRSQRIADFATHRQRAHREHRRAPAAHGDGEAARRDLVRGPGPRREDRRRSTRPTSRRCSPTSSRTKTCRGTFCERRAIGADAVLAGSSARLRSSRCRRRGCGKKGPPLPPLVSCRSRPPTSPPSAAATRSTCDFTVPGANTDGTRPANIARVDVYAHHRRRPTVDRRRSSLKRGTKVGSVAVKAPRDPNDTIDAGRDRRPTSSRRKARASIRARVARVDETADRRRADARRRHAGRQARRAAASERADGPLLGPPSRVLTRTYVARRRARRAARNGPLSSASPCRSCRRRRRRRRRRSRTTKRRSR